MVYYWVETALCTSISEESAAKHNRQEQVRMQITEKRRILFTDAALYDITARTFLPGALLCEDGVIRAVLKPYETVQDAQVHSLGGKRVIPGLVDVHTHGRIGYDFIDASAAQLQKMRRAYALCGTTTVLPTLASAPYAQMLEAVRRIRQAGFDGAHIEGRYLSPARRGAHAPELLSPPSAAEAKEFFDAAQGGLLHFTLAPELDGAADMIRAICAMGGTCSVGHSDASYEQAKAAEALGCTGYTHLYNCMPPMHHRAPGCAVAALEGEGYCEIICDGFHLHPAVVRLTKRQKRQDRLVLITDSLSAAGCADGEYSIAGIGVTVKDGKALNREGHIAGSTISLFEGLCRFMRFCEITLEEALPYATINAAKSVGLDAVCGALRAGCRADFLVLENETNAAGDPVIAGVFCGGEEIREERTLADHG